MQANRKVSSWKRSCAVELARSDLVQKMLWGRDGAHNVLQIRTSIASKSWTTDWEKVEKILYKEVA